MTTYEVCTCPPKKSCPIHGWTTVDATPERAAEWFCPDCGGTYPPDEHPGECHPNAVLREPTSDRAARLRRLVEHWKATAEGVQRYDSDVGAVLLRCAWELETILDGKDA